MIICCCSKLVPQLHGAFLNILMDDLDDPKPKEGSGVYLFGRDVMSIPCFRTCGLTGCSATLASTILYFMFTSNSKKSLKVGFSTFMIVTFPYWFYCSSQHYATQLKLHEVRQTIQSRTEDEYEVIDSLEGIEAEVY